MGNWKDTLLNSNDYQRGYTDGRNDALAGENRSYSGMASMKSLIHGNNSMDTYVDGYKTGYTDGMREKNFLNEDNNPPEKNDGSVWDSLINSDGYKRGYNDGRSHAIAGKNKDYRGMCNLKSLIHGDHAMETYSKGYNDGYTDGLREKNLVNVAQQQSINNKTDDKMGFQYEEFDTELLAIEELYNFLVKVCDGIKQEEVNFTAHIDNMKAAGVPKEICDKFTTDYYDVDKQQFDALYDHIINVDLPQIEKYFDVVNNSLGEANGDCYSKNFHQPSDKRPTVNSPMPTITAMNITLQIDSCCYTLDYLADLWDNLDEILDKYCRYCDQLVQAGVPTEFCDQYIEDEEYYPDDEKKIREIQENLKDKDYPYILNQFTSLIASLTTTGAGTYTRTPKPIGV